MTLGHDDSTINIVMAIVVIIFTITRHNSSVEFVDGRAVGLLSERGDGRRRRRVDCSNESVQPAARQQILPARLRQYARTTAAGVQSPRQVRALSLYMLYTQTRSTTA